MLARLFTRVHFHSSQQWAGSQDSFITSNKQCVLVHLICAKTKDAVLIFISLIINEVKHFLNLYVNFYIPF